ncbi:MAG: LptF/LptG family permease [Sodaliphilus sp.]|nr:LptF/LptG family permease [Sodaliphilus sp.]
MLKIKRLYLFILQTFLPLFMMTFFICLFIVMMQFLWKYIDELVGKGLAVSVIGELFFYAALTMIPLALPLAILLASLMTFGNLGEHFELTAMKASGVSLIRVMKPLIVFITLIAIGAFFFQNDVLPKAQVKMWTLLFSMRQKSPTLDIPEGAIYSQIPGYNLYVKHKNPKNDMLYNLLIYDVSSGQSYPRIVAADSGSLSMTKDKTHLVLKLYKGDWYEDVAVGSNASVGTNMYRREAFDTKDIFIPYDANFTRMDDQTMKSQYIGKNISELNHTIDSVSRHVDSVGNDIAMQMKVLPVVGMPSVTTEIKDDTCRVEVPVRQVALARPIDFDSLCSALSVPDRLSLVSEALSRASMAKQDNEFRSYSMTEDKFTIRRHQIELQKKFTLSLACLIFFFIGAPLGAIIRKGGLGTPIVISVLLFIVYYIIDNMGYKLARDGRWEVWHGIWLSSAVLLPLGIFLTYKAVNDSAVLNVDAYRNFFRRLAGMHQVRKLALKEVVIEEVDTPVAVRQLQELHDTASAFLRRYPHRMSFIRYWMYGYDKKALRSLSAQIDGVVDYLSNSRSQLVINKAMDFPVVRQLLIYHPTNYPKLGAVLAALLPVSLPVYLVALKHLSNLKYDVNLTCKVCDELLAMLQGDGDGASLAAESEND